MMASFPHSRARGPANSFLFFFRLFRLSRLAPVVFVHRRVDPLGQDHLHGVARLTGHFRRYFQLRLLHRAQHVGCKVANRMIRPAPDSYPRKVFRAKRADHGLCAVVPAVTSLGVNPDRSPRELLLIPNHQQIVEIQLVLSQQVSHRNAAEIHVGLRLRQDHLFLADLSPAHQRLALRPLHANPAAICTFIDSHKTQVVRRPLILRIRIPKPDNQPHKPRFACPRRPPARGLRKGYFFFSVFSVFSVFSALGLASSSTAFLPFLMTSGSAGAATSAATASTGFSSSTRRVTTCAITRSGSVISFILAVSIGNSLTRNCLPSISSLTSILNSAGISLGRHSISTSRVTISNTPPCTFTPAGSPNVCTGTFTLMRTSMVTRSRSTCSNLPVAGSTSQSFRIAGSCFPPRFT